MADPIKLAFSQEHPTKRACGTCRHFDRHKSNIRFSKCEAIGGTYAHIERDKGTLCGPAGAFWEPVPPPPPRRTLKQWWKEVIG